MENIKQDCMQKHHYEFCDKNNLDYGLMENLIKKEGYRTKAYVPSDNSGVTLGTGVDVGQHYRQEFEAMQIPEQHLAILDEAYVQDQGSSKIRTLGDKAKALLPQINSKLSANDCVQFDNAKFLSVLKKMTRSIDNICKSDNLINKLHPVVKSELFQNIWHYGSFNQGIQKAIKDSYDNNNTKYIADYFRSISGYGNRYNNAADAIEKVPMFQ